MTHENPAPAPETGKRVMHSRALMRDIARDLGFAAAAKLSAAFAKQRFKVPVRVTRDHKIARLAGAEIFCWLVTHRGGQLVYISAIDERRERIRLALSVRQQSESLGLPKFALNQIARHAGCDFHTVKRLAARPAELLHVRLLVCPQ